MAGAERGKADRDGQWKGTVPVRRARNKPVTPLPLPGRSSSEALIRLQRQAGNQALVISLQRDGVAADEITTWAEIGGPALIDAIKAECAAWKAFRALPTTHGEMPGRNLGPIVIHTASRMFDLRNNDPNLYAKVKQYATSFVGAVRPELIELVSFNSGFGTIDDIFYGISKRAPGHQYVLNVMQQHGLVDDTIKPIEDIPRDLIDKLPDGPTKKYLKDLQKKAIDEAKKKVGVLAKLMFSEVAVTYSSAAFGNWGWTEKLFVAGLTLSVGVKKQRGSKTQGGNLTAGPLTLTFTGQAKATTAPAAFWGPKDFTGQVMVASGGVAAKVPGAAADIGVAQLIEFFGGPVGALQFGELSGTAVKEGSTLDDAEFSVSLGTGAGYAVAHETESWGAGYIARPVLREKVLFRGGVKDYAVASPTAVPVLMTKLRNAIGQKLDLQRAEYAAFGEELRNLGLDEPFSCDFFVDGYASRAWLSATTEEERLEKNQALSLRRAQEAATALEATLPEPHRFQVEGKGASVVIAGSRVLDDEVGARMEQERAKMRRQNIPEHEIERSLERVYGRRAEFGEYRAVKVMVIWRGYAIEYEPILASSEDRPPVSDDYPSHGPGHGGGEGAYPWPRDSGTGGASSN